MRKASFHTMARIFVNRYFYPDHSATSQLLSDLVFALAESGETVSVVTSRQLLRRARRAVGGVRGRQGRSNPSRLDVTIRSRQSSGSWRSTTRHFISRRPGSSGDWHGVATPLSRRPIRRCCLLLRRWFAVFAALSSSTGFRMSFPKSRKQRDWAQEDFRGHSIGVSSKFETDPF